MTKNFIWILFLITGGLLVTTLPASSQCVPDTYPQCGIGDSCAPDPSHTYEVTRHSDCNYTCVDLGRICDQCGNPPPPNDSCQAAPQDECTSGVCCDTSVSPHQFYGSDHVCNGPWTVNSCWGTSCGDDVKYQTFTQRCSGDSDNCTGSTILESEGTSEYCEPWEVCTDSDCACSSNCLEAPANLFPANGAENVKLPVALSWQSVNGAELYRYRIEETETGRVIEGATTTPEITIENCRLKSNKNYNWKIRACCDLDGSSCGSWSSSWSFETSPAPELLSPENNADSIPFPTTFDWCDVRGAEAYSLRVYRNNNEESFSPIPVSKTNGQLFSEFVDILDFLTKNTTYQWEVAACLAEDGSDCQEEDHPYSQRWSLTTTGLFPIPQLLSPPNDPAGNNPLGFPLTLDWAGVERAVSYYYEIQPTAGLVRAFITTVSEATFGPSRLLLDTIYSWRVKACWDYEGELCESFSEEWHFKTTGASPANLNESPTNGEGRVLIPAKLDWNDVSGAGSYKYRVSSDNGFNNIVADGAVENSEISLDYPSLEMEAPYWWQIKTCADKNGEICGNWSSARNFTTFKLPAPTNPNPGEGGTIFVNNPIGWGQVSGARFYQHKVDYLNKPSEEIKEICPSLVGQEVIHPTITQFSPVHPSLECLGGYQWTVRACLDQGCQQAGNWSPLWHFTVIQPTPAAAGGIVPCGRSYDDPTTPYNEREACQFKHLFLLLKNILDFLLWRLGLIILVLLSVATGVIYYFSMGAPQTMGRVKSILKSAVIGYLIILLSWLIINWALAILGFQIGIFGRWWQITF